MDSRDLKVEVSRQPFAIRLLDRQNELICQAAGKNGLKKELLLYRLLSTGRSGKLGARLWSWPARGVFSIREVDKGLDILLGKPRPDLVMHLDFYTDHILHMHLARLRSRPGGLFNGLSLSFSSPQNDKSLALNLEPCGLVFQGEDQSTRIVWDTPPTAWVERSDKFGNQTARLTAWGNQMDLYVFFEST